MATRIPPGYIVSGRSAEGVSESFDCTATVDRGRLWWLSSAQSAVFSLEASHDESVWGVVETYTATAQQSGSAQWTGYYPYVRCNVNKLSSATAGGATATAVLWVYWSPVI